MRPGLRRIDTHSRLQDVSCAAITAAIVVAATWLAVHGTCPGNLKAYIFIPERNSCVR